MCQEIMKMVHFDHPNVMSLIGVCIPPSGITTRLCIVMPFMEKGNLLDYLRKQSDHIIVTDQNEVSVGFIC